MKLLHVTPVILRFLVFMLLLHLNVLSNQVTGEDTDIPKGHMQPLGSHKPPLPVTEFDTLPSPQTFYDEFVKASKPVIFRGAAKKIPAFELWTDEYMSDKFGTVQVLVEEGKKENRSLGNFLTSLKNFISTYKNQDSYVVHTLPKSMREDIKMLSCVSCGGFAQKLIDAVMWFSSGGTKSVLHLDTSDNINCLFRGSKDLFMIDKKVDASRILDNDGFSGLDVDKVDLKKYSDLLKMDWYDAKISAGDCVYIPYYWLHQIRSYDNNLAVNMWWTPMLKFNKTSCDGNNDMTYLRMNDFEFATYEVLRKSLLDAIRRPVTKKKLAKVFVNFGEELGEYDLNAVFAALDTNKDGMVAADEVNELPYDTLVNLFPDWRYGDDEGSEAEQEQDINRDEL